MVSQVRGGKNGQILRCLCWQDHECAGLIVGFVALRSSGCMVKKLGRCCTTCIGKTMSASASLKSSQRVSIHELHLA